MPQDHPFNCRIVACAETGCRSGEWSFYLINDDDRCIDQAVLMRCGHDRCEQDDMHLPNLRLSKIPPGGHALLWRDEDHGDCLWLELRIRIGRRMQDLLFEFQRLGRGGAPVAGLGLSGLTSQPRH